MTEARKLSEIPLRLIDGTASPKPSIVDLPKLDLKNLPARLDDSTLAMVEVIASSPLPALPACDERHFLKCFRILQVNLPKRATDDLGGEIMAATYQRMLGHLANDAISYLTEIALAECQWFPTIAECLSIVRRWQRSDEAWRRKALAISRARSERQARFDEALEALRIRSLGQDAIDALPEHTKRVAAERCYLWRHPDGTFTVRSGE